MNGARFRRLSAVMLGALCGLVALTASGPAAMAGPPAGNEGSGAQAAPLTRHESIAQVVQQLNARAVLPKAEDAATGLPGGKFKTAARIMLGPVPEGGAGCSVDVALVAADDATNTDDVSDKLLADGRIASVTVIDTRSVTPTFDELMAFDSVMVWTNSTPLSNVLLGNSIADYVDAGGGVVLTMFAMQEATSSRTLSGRFLTDNYYCIQRVVGAFVTGFATLGSVVVPGHALMEGVSSFDGGLSGFRAQGALHPQATRVADWSTGEILIAARQDLGGRRVDLGFFPVSNDVTATWWNATTDGATMLANALVHTGGCPNVGLAGCPPMLFAQSPPDPLLEARNSNTQPNTLSTQQIADDFSIPDGGTVNRVVLWAVYTGDGPVPAGQRFVLNIWNDASGNPGSIIHTTTTTASPQYTGEVQTGNIAPHRLYRFIIDLPQPFVATAATTYWLNPMGDNNDNSWAWQFVTATGDRRSRTDGAAAWTSFPSDLAFELCGDDGSGSCPADLNGDGTVNVLDLLQMLGAWGGC